MTNEPIFINPNSGIKEDCDVIFVSDMFEDEYVGGAELTTAAIIDSSPLKIQKIKSSHVNMSTLVAGSRKHWIFGNFALLNAELIPTIIANLRYSIVEYDYKFCRFRSPEKHEASTGSPCDCSEQMNGKIVSAFYYGASSLWWMSEKQKERYLTHFPFLSEKENIVLSSVFSRKTLGVLQQLRNLSSSDPAPRKGWIVLGSDSWVKGADAAKKWCQDNDKDYEVVWGLPYEEMLTKLSKSEGLVYLPAGGDTCPRLVIEAKLVGCKLELNDNVQHAKESWFDTDDIDQISDYLFASPEVFWTAIKKIIDYKPTISGYTTTYNCTSRGYPFETSIRSMLQFCDEVCVVDGGSTDDTWDKLCQWALKEPKLVLRQHKIDFSNPRFAYESDGKLKAMSRKMCTGDFCWQMDSDEIVHELDAPKILELCGQLPKQIDIIGLPVVEYWGGPDKVRVDVQPWKWRLSRNLPHITHGIPSDLRRMDPEGNLYAAEGTDGCDMIHSDTGERLPFVTFHNSETENLRRAAANGNLEALKAYESWFNSAVENLPGVYHYSWYDMSRKIRNYRDHWSKFWGSLYNKSVEDTADNNVMFDVPWSQVTEEMIESRANEFRIKLGGWIWHKKWDGKTLTPHIKINRTEPSI